MLSRVYGASTLGVDARLIEVEVHMGSGLPRYFLVGLPDRAVSESRDRIEAALRSSGNDFPRGRITVNLAPANLPKEGSSFDLPIALALLAVSGQATGDKLLRSVAIGELALDGSLRPVKGVLPIALEARRKGVQYMIVPESNAAEASLVEGLTVLPFASLSDVMDWLDGTVEVRPLTLDPDRLLGDQTVNQDIDFSDVRGQESVRRALEVAAAGGHNLVMVGPPGSGKTMMARRLPTILPPMTMDEAIETTKIHSVAGMMPTGSALVAQRPFRAPHHTVSDTALAGGGSIPGPGELSKAHNGVLFLDELPEFKRSVLEVLRQPLEDGEVLISRTKMSVRYPGRFMLVASMNPSPSGGWYDPSDSEGVTTMQMRRYLGKISGPLLDRIDLHIEVNKVSYDELSSDEHAESSEMIRDRVIEAREIQTRRFLGLPGVYCNAQMSTRMVRRYCNPKKEGLHMLKKVMKHLQLSARAFDRILKVSRTIADLDGSESVETHHLAEAVQYRSLDREGWLTG